MKALAHIIFAGLTPWLGQTQPTTANPQAGKIDGDRSTITVRVYKSGLFSALAHDHTRRRGF